MGKPDQRKLPKAFEPVYPTRDIINDRGVRYPDLQNIKKNSDPSKVFLNVPYDAEYLQRLLPSIITTCWAFKLIPFRLSDDVAGPRLSRLTDHILQSQFVVTDVSRAGRMNMPFEAGLALGLGRSCAFLVDNQRRCERDFSDLKGMDLLEHADDPARLIRVLSRWFKSRFKQRRWPQSTVISQEKLISVVEPRVRQFIEDRADDDETIEEIRTALTAFWQRADVDYMQEHAEARRLPFDRKVERKRIATMQRFFAAVG